MSQKDLIRILGSYFIFTLAIYLAKMIGTHNSHITSLVDTRSDRKIREEKGIFLSRAIYTPSQYEIFDEINFCRQLANFM